ncbi:MAG: hypothetical protein M1834_005501 [Cirrosporium novae-zelandiae]|nr:MAG: hypothetical protein M1834_005501 [Cirrosporium novae-zelandiae]
MGSRFDLPKQYKAVVYDKPGSISTKIEMLDVPEPGFGEVLINLTHSGVCHSDLGVMTNSWHHLPFPTPPGQVGGHEGVGIVVKLGPGAEKSTVKVGDRVGVKWVSATCGTCPACLEYEDGICFNQKISGYYTPGTFQQYVLGPANYITPIPEELSSADAAPMLCAGVTTYSALKKSGAKPGQWVIISGAGGGLGHIAVQLAAKGMGFRVLGIDHGSKAQFVKDSGAEAFIDITAHDDESIVDEVKGHTGGLGAKAVIVCTASNRAYAQAIDMLRFGGTLVCVGMPEGDPVPIAKSYPAAMVFKHATITSSAVGDRMEAIEALDFAARGIVKTHHRIEKMEKLTEVFKEMEAQKLQGRVVLDLS